MRPLQRQFHKLSVLLDDKAMVSFTWVVFTGIQYFMLWFCDFCGQVCNVYGQ